MTPQQQCLLDLLLAYEHMVRAVEVQGPPRHVTRNCAWTCAYLRD